MAWKKLAFTDEMLTNPMTESLDMGGQDIINAVNIGPSGQTGSINLKGGSGQGAQVRVYGEDHASYAGSMRVFVTNAAKNNMVDALRIDGVTDTPIVDILHGLDMNQKDIENVVAIRPKDEAGFGVMMEDANGVDQVEFGIGAGSYAMVAYRPIDMNQKAFDGMVFGNLATAPHAASEVQGEAYYNTADDHVHVWVV